MARWQEALRGAGLVVLGSWYWARQDSAPHPATALPRSHLQPQPRNVCGVAVASLKAATAHPCDGSD